MQTQFRICIEWLLPSSQRTGPYVDNAIADQAPVSDWLFVDEWFRDLQYLRSVRPVHKVGLLIGQQKREWEGNDFAEKCNEAIAEMKVSATGSNEEIMAYFEKQNVLRAARQADMVRRVDEFIASFDFTAYGLAEGLDRLAAVSRVE